MDDNRDKRTRASSDDTGIDGEYHFVRPEQRLYEDAPQEIRRTSKTASPCRNCT